MDKMESLSTHSRTYEEIAIERIKMLTDIIHNYHVYAQSARSIAMISEHICAGKPVSPHNTYKPVYELVREVLNNKY
jgi:hypothetical protein